MRPRTLFALLVLVGGLGAYLWFVERDLPSSEERAERGKKVLGGLEADDVRAVVLEWGDHRVRLERQAPAKAGAGGEPAAGGGGEESDASEADDDPAALALDAGSEEAEWRLTEPAGIAPARADRAAVDRLLDAVLGLAKTRTVEGVDPAAAGLDPPRAKVVLSTGGEGGDAAVETVLSIGAAVPASSSTLVGVAGRPEAYVVDGGIYDDVARPPGDWRDRRLFTAGRDEVERVTLRGGPAGEPVVLVRRGEEFWLDRPLVDRADRDQVDRLLSDLAALAVRSFVDGPGRPPADLGLEPPAAVVEASLRGGAGGDGGAGAAEAPFRLELGAPVAEGATARYGRAGGQLFEVQTPLFEAAERPAADWQSPALSGLRLYQIDRAVVERGGAQLVLARDGSEWKRGEATISYTPVSELLTALTEARAERFLRRDEARREGAALDAPALAVTLEPAAGAPAETLALYPPAPSLDGRVPATAGGRDFVLLLPPDAGDQILDKLDRLERAEPVAEEPAEAAPAGT
jgi:hypothetical protein